jgi:hypothetical protein
MDRQQKGETDRQADRQTDRQYNRSRSWMSHLWNVDGVVVLVLDRGPLRYAVPMEGERCLMPRHVPPLDYPLALPAAGRHDALQELNLVKLAGGLPAALARGDCRARQDAVAFGAPLRVHRAVPSTGDDPVALTAAPRCSCRRERWKGGTGSAKWQTWLERKLNLRMKSDGSRS